MSIVGYTYKAALLCCDCARELGIKQAHEHGDAYSWGDCGDAEDTLSSWAMLIGLDREDETTFDHADFPKRVTRQQIERAHGEGADTWCGTCHDWDLRQLF